VGVNTFHYQFLKLWFCYFRFEKTYMVIIVAVIFALVIFLIASAIERMFFRRTGEQTRYTYHSHAVVRIYVFGTTICC